MPKSFGKLKIAAIVIILIGGALLALPFLLNADKFKPQVEQKISDVLGRATTIGDLRLALLSGGIAADNIAIADDPAYGKSPFVSAKALRVGVELRPLIFSQSIRITGITLEQPEITLIRSEAGEWNFSSLGGKPVASQGNTGGDKSATLAKTDILIGSLKIIDGRMTIAHRDGAIKPRVYDKVNLTIRDLSLTSEFPFNMTANLPGGEGTAELNGKAGPVNMKDASLTPFSAKLAVAHLNLVASGFIEPGSGIAGVINFNGDVASDGKQLQSQGKANAEGFQAVKGGTPAKKPLSIDYAITYNLRNQTGTINKTTIGMGKAIAQLDGGYDMSGKSALLRMKLRGEKMPVEELAAFLPAAGVTLPEGASLQGGTVSIDLAGEGPVENLVSAGSVAVLNTRLAGFDLGAKMQLVAKVAGINASPDTDIERFSLDARFAQGEIQVGNLLLAAPALGQLSGNGVIGLNRSLDFKMSARLIASGGVLGGLARMTSSGGGRELTIPFSIRGTTLKPSFVPDARGIAGGLLGNIVPGGNANTEGGNQNPSLGDTLRNLLKKKEK
jgi:AsmA protein